MAEYIEAINSLNPQPLSQLPTSFDPKSLVNQKTLEQIQKCRLITKTIMEWSEQMRKSGAEYFGNLSKVHNGAIQVMRELETEISNWKNEEVEWATKTTQMREVQTYGVMKFLVEKPMPRLDDSILYVCQKNIEWRNSLIKQAYEEFRKLADQLAELTTSMRNELLCIGIKCLKSDGTLETVEVITKSFEKKINYVKEAKGLVSDDLTTIAKIESLLFLCIGHLDSHSNKVAQVHKEKEVWKQHIAQVGLPHKPVIQHFITTFSDWKKESFSQNRFIFFQTIGFIF